MKTKEPLFRHSRQLIATTSQPVLQCHFFLSSFVLSCFVLHFVLLETIQASQFISGPVLLRLRPNKMLTSLSFLDSSAQHLVEKLNLPILKSSPSQWNQNQNNFTPFVCNELESESRRECRLFIHHGNQKLFHRNLDKGYDFFFGISQIHQSQTQEGEIDIILYGNIAKEMYNLLRDPEVFDYNVGNPDLLPENFGFYKPISPLEQRSSDFIRCQPREGSHYLLNQVIRGFLQYICHIRINNHGFIPLLPKDSQELENL
jgi:hypothetical protein